MIRLSNGVVAVDFDRQTGRYSLLDLLQNKTAIKDAYARIDELATTHPEAVHRTRTKRFADELGRGKALLVTTEIPRQPTFTTEIRAYDHKDFLTFKMSLTNTTQRPYVIKEMLPLEGGLIFPGEPINENFAILDGRGGGEPTRIWTNQHVRTRNNVMMTYGSDEDRRTLVAGGLTYFEFEKYAEVGIPAESRKAMIQERLSDDQELLCYLDLGVDRRDTAQTGEQLSLQRGESYHMHSCEDLVRPEQAMLVYEDDQIMVDIKGLESQHPYLIGFSLAEQIRDRTQSVWIDTGPDTEQKMLVESVRLIAVAEDEAPVEYVFSIPEEFVATGAARLVFHRDSGSNVIANEVWLKRGVLKDGPYIGDVPYAQEVIGPIDQLPLRMYSLDPVGKRVDPGVTYDNNERYYIDFMTVCPFDSLERYALNLRSAQRIQLNYYDFPTVCLWYAEVFGDFQIPNDTRGAVIESIGIEQSGFLKYSRAAVRLVPDCYSPINQQGWWDDEHWRRWTGDPARGNGRYVEPFETTEKWAQAVIDRGVMPFTYMQTGRTSADYGPTFPDHMLHKDPLASYDYTSEGFQEHLDNVYDNLRDGGVVGLMFDYAYSGWHEDGGFEDPYATAAEAYRNIYRLPREGLGANAWVHERNLRRGSDISLGLVASQRVWGDTDIITPPMASKAGMRWYKNRVVVNYDMDAKSLLKANPDNRIGRQALLTMTYVVSGRFLVGNSFTLVDDEKVYDMSRTFPYHTMSRSARPLDMLVNEFPRVYDFKVNDGWHQLTLWNYDPQTYNQIALTLSGRNANGQMELDSQAEYYFYDFWNDRLAARLSGDDTLTQTLSPGEARMLSVRQVQPNPQVLSTDRHIMQGLVELKDVKWDPEGRKLSGYAKCIKHEPFKIVIAQNGFEPIAAFAQNADEKLSPSSVHNELSELTITSKQSGSVHWKILFKCRD